MTSKQRAYLRGLANNIDAIFQVGKSGISDVLLEQLDKALEARELIKVSVLETAPVYDYRCVLNTDGTGPRSLRLRWRWLDQENGILLVTLQTEELP